MVAEVHEFNATPTCFHIADLADQPPPEFLVDGLYVERTFSLVYGPPKSGKTHLASQLVYDLATGDPHFGRTVKKRGSLILAGEGANAIGLRARAFAKHRDIDLHDLDIQVETDKLDFLDEDVGDTVGQVCRACERLKTPGVIVVDPWGKFMRRGDENSSQDVGRALETAHAIMDKTECSLIAVHHTPASTTGRPRGHTSLLADVEMAGSVVKNGTRSMTVTDARFVPDGIELAFDLEVVDLDNGVSACVVVPVESTNQKKAVRVPPSASRALRELHDCLARGGQPAPASNHIPQLQRVVPADLWRTSFLSRQISDRDNRDSLKRSFNRSVQKLQDLGLIGVWDGWVWLPGQT